MLSRAPGSPSFHRLHRGSGDKQITDLAGRPIHSVKEPAIQHDAGANASADGKKNKVPYSLCGADLTFRNGRSIHIVLYRRRNTEPGFQQRAQRNIAPTHEIGRGNHDALIHIRDAGRSGRNRAKQTAR